MIEMRSHMVVLLLACAYALSTVGCGTKGKVVAPGVAVEIEIPAGDPCLTGSPWLPQELESGECIMRCNAYCMFCGVRSKVYRCDQLLDMLEQAYQSRERERRRRQRTQPGATVAVPTIEYELVSYATPHGTEVVQPLKLQLMTGVEKFHALDIDELFDALEEADELNYGLVVQGLAHVHTPVVGLVDGTDFVAVAYLLEPETSGLMLAEEHGLVAGEYPLFVATVVADAADPTGLAMAVAAGHPIAVASHLQALYDLFEFSGALVSLDDSSVSVPIDFMVGIGGMQVVVDGQVVLVQNDVAAPPKWSIPSDG